jgi:antitoxin component of MazEF toxin-antitoxin module
MQNKVFKTGHSLAVTLSPKVLKEVGLNLGDAVKVEVDDNGHIIIRKSKRENQLPLNLKIRPSLTRK